MFPDQSSRIANTFTKGRVEISETAIHTQLLVYLHRRKQADLLLAAQLDSDLHSFQEPPPQSQTSGLLSPLRNLANLNS